jgi:hypothetical protein
MKEFEEIGGRCDMQFICDICGEDECHYDENEELVCIKIFKVGTQDICEFCLQKIVTTSAESIEIQLKKEL